MPPEVSGPCNLGSTARTQGQVGPFKEGGRGMRGRGWAGLGTQREKGGGRRTIEEKGNCGLPTLWVWLVNNNHDPFSSLSPAHTSTPPPRFKPFKKLRLEGISFRSFIYPETRSALDLRLRGGEA